MLAWTLAALLVTTGTLHFAAERSYESIIPRFLGSPSFWVIISGIVELTCAAMLMFARTRAQAGWACVALFVAVFPANITMAVNSLHGDGTVWLAWVRLPLQIPLVLWALYIARHAGTDAGKPIAEPITEPIDGVRD